MMVGDVIGKPGRRAVREVMPGLRQRYLPDLVIANAENAAGGLGLSLSTAEEILDSGVDILTSGNHIWDKKGDHPPSQWGITCSTTFELPPGGSWAWLYKKRRRARGQPRGTRLYEADRLSLQEYGSIAS